MKKQILFIFVMLMILSCFTAGTAQDETWTCENGHSGLTGNFCPECGAKKPE